MTLPDLQGEALDSWFLQQMEALMPQGAAKLLAMVMARNKRGDKVGAHTWADTLIDALLSAREELMSLDVMLWKAENALAGERTDWRKMMDRLAGNDPGRRMMVEKGFHGNLVPAESVRRVRRLWRLQQGAFCYNKTWGFGVVRRVDSFYGRVEVDFSGRPGHQLAMEYAAGSLDLVSPDHLLAVQHAAPEKMAALVKENPAEVVRMALRSFGPLPAALLQEQLSPAIVAPGDWKAFWEGARKRLKSDPLVVMPAKRSDPIRLLDENADQSALLLEKLARERDMNKVLDLVEEWLAQKPVEERDTKERAVVEERLAFVIKGAGIRQAGVSGRALILAGQAKMQSDKVDAAGLARAFLDGDLIEPLHRLPTRMVAAFCTALYAAENAKTRQRLLEILFKLNLGPMSEAFDLLAAWGEEPACAAAVREACVSQTAGVELLAWVIRHPEKITAWQLGDEAALSGMMLNQIEEDYGWEKLKAQKVLREKFEQTVWLKRCFECLNPDKRVEFFKRISVSRGWSSLDRKSVQARILKLHPELGELLTQRAAPAPTHGVVTSERSYRERQAMLEKITNVDIPNNTREIAVARSYGDLRENAEFKAAKEMQGVLMRRKAELEQMLHEVHPTDFHEFNAEKAGIATSVTLQFESGRHEQYCILGVWDQHDELRVISCDSRLAKVLEGHVAGDEVLAPTEHGEEKCRLVDVAPIPADIKIWLETKPV